jgi:hypothetical protein
MPPTLYLWDNMDVSRLRTLRLTLELSDVHDDDDVKNALSDTLQDLLAPSRSLESITLVDLRMQDLNFLARFKSLRSITFERSLLGTKSLSRLTQSVTNCTISHAGCTVQDEESTPDTV